MPTMLENALALRAIGPVFPCEPRGKRPLGSLAPHGCHDATRDESQIRAWWAAAPDANVGLATGPDSVDVLDVDAKGIEAVVELEGRLCDLPRTPVAETPGGGFHYFFKPC